MCHRKAAMCLEKQGVMDTLVGSGKEVAGCPWLEWLAPSPGGLGHTCLLCVCVCSVKELEARMGFWAEGCLCELQDDGPGAESVQLNGTKKLPSTA